MALSQQELDTYFQQAQARIAAKNFSEQHKRKFFRKDQWYPWQMEGFDSLYPQTMVIAGNRTGKTMSAAFHTALDLTGDYPDWYTGFRFEHAPNVLALGVDNQQLKDVVQLALFGEVVEPESGPKHFSGGWVHAEEIGRIEWSNVTKNLARRIEVFSKYGRSACTLRSYTQSKTGHGTLSFAGTSIDLIWVDECPPDALVGQLVTRTMTGNYGRGGRIRYTMTPELGATDLVTNFMEYREHSQHLIGPVAWSECKHLTPEIQEQILSALPEHERDMRSKGTPFFGQGLVYTVPDERLRTERFELRTIPWLKYIRAIDLGIQHPTAIAWLAYDAEIDRIYLLRTYSGKNANAATNAAVANSYLDFAPVVFPHDVESREKGSGKTVRDWYRDAGIKNTLDFKNPDGSLHVEPGIMDLNERMRSDRFKVVDGECEEFYREKRLYHRDNGKIVALNDDVLSAVRYGSQMITRNGVGMGGRTARRKPRVKKSFT